MGCKSNQLEGCLIEENLINSGYEKADKITQAQLFILNSCSVTHKSDNEALYILHQAKKQNPQIKCVLTGCIAQTEKEQLLENPDIDIVLGNDEKLDISNYLSEKIAVKDIMGLNDFHKVLLTDTKKTRASLKIQDGCDNRCSYCIIPFARGKSRSADLDFILEQIKIYEQAGFKEIILTGIHIGQYEWNGDYQKGLLYLLKNIEEKTNIPRYRLGSLNPLEIGDEMLEFFKTSQKFCAHFHLSLQSMCDKTLKSMNRHYSVNQAMELIDKIDTNLPLCFMGSDIIAGFAGESEEDFLTTLENLKKSKLTQIHTFPYSIRKNTAAEKIEGHLPQKVKQERADLIKQISAQKYQEFLQKNLNTIQEVLIEKRLDVKTGLLKGVTRNYINVLIQAEEISPELKNSLQRVKISDVSQKVYGEIL